MKQIIIFFFLFLSNVVIAQHSISRYLITDKSTGCFSNMPDNAYPEVTNFCVFDTVFYFVSVKSGAPNDIGNNYYYSTEIILNGSLLATFRYPQIGFFSGGTTHCGYATLPLEGNGEINFKVYDNNGTKLAFEFTKTFNVSCCNKNTNTSDVNALSDLNSYLTNDGVFLQNWGKCDPCKSQWKGVTCSGNRVVKLDISGNNLSLKVDELLSYIQSLTNLNELNLSNNNLTGTISNFNFSQLPNLNLINLSKNKISGKIPDSLSRFVNFDLSNNDFSGCIPVSLSKRCPVSNFNRKLDNNPKLPFSGNFTSFCGLTNKSYQTGTPCNDNNSLTTNDTISTDCVCRGKSALTPSLVWVEGGSFVMGCTEEQKDLGLGCYNDEKPLRRVLVSSFYIGKYEVTQGEWIAMWGTNPSFTAYGGIGNNYPVNGVSWYDAVVYCNRLSEQEGLEPYYYSGVSLTQVYGKSGNSWSMPNSGTVYIKTSSKGYRLPTEAEWEYAARGGNLSKGYGYSGSNDLNRVGWYDGNSTVSYTPNNNGRGQHEVGQKQGNELGIYDMGGNVWEWCYDWYSTYMPTPECNPTGPTGGSWRVFRGSDWRNSEGNCRLSIRNNNNPAFRNFSLGFRLCRPQ